MRSLAAAVLLAATCLPVTAAAPAGPETAPSLNLSILEGARVWLTRGPAYDASYYAIPYPGGDVPADRGACVDLIVRALRHAGLDLQRLIQEDRLARPAAYGAARPPDPNLDHRRSANHVIYLRRHARSLTTRTDGTHLREWLPGDLVYYGRRRAWHAGIVSDRASPSGVPYIIDSHQEAGGVSESFLLTRWGPILAHFRVEDRRLDRGLQSGP
jgi:hypothetical protein